MRIRPWTRHGRCYELAFRYLLFDERYSVGWRLVHGETVGPFDKGRMGHAWLESDEMVYDAVLDVMKPILEFERRYAAIRDRSYSKEEAAQRSLASDNSYGPWEINRLFDE